MNTIRDFIRGFRRGAADPLPRGLMLTALAAALGAALSFADGDVMGGAIRLVLAGTLVEVAVLRRDVRRARAAEAVQAARAWRWEAEARRAVALDYPMAEAGNGYLKRVTRS